MIGGGAMGLLLARLVRLERAVRDLQLRRPAAAAEPFATATATEPEPTSATASRAPAIPARSAIASTDPHWSDWDSTVALEKPSDDKADASDAAWARRPLEPSLLRQGLGQVKHWFMNGNVPVKVGVLVSFVGFSFLLKYAIDKELIFLPLELRLLGVGLVGLVLVGIGWRLRTKVRSYALSLQGGGLGILFLTVFTAFRIWSLISPGLAFTLLVLLAIATAALAMIQNARTLAIFGVVGGFLAPLLASTGEGSHVVLFSYYLVINGAVFGLAWFHAWRGLNLVGWAFTFVIGSFWGYQYYRPELFTSTEPFLALHFLLYNTIAILFALRQPPEKAGLVDGALVFGTPVVGFALQAALLSDSEYGLAISAAALAIFYAAISLVVLRRRGEELGLLRESFNALAVTFATLAIPLALDARWTAAAWALEGAALVWIGIRQKHSLANLAGTLLIFGSGAAFWEYGWKTGRGLPVLNGNVLGSVLISISALFSSWQLGKYTSKLFSGAYRLAGLALFLWGAAWWLGVGLIETLDRPTRFSESHTYLLFLSLSTLATISLAGKLGWHRLRKSSAILLPLLALLGIYNFWVDQHSLFGLGWLAWPVGFFVLASVLKVFDQHQERLAGAWHLGSVLLLTALLANEAWWQVAQLLSRTWAGAAGSIVAGLAALTLWRLRGREAWPPQRHPAVYLDASILIVAAMVLYLTGLSIAEPGDPDPLFYIPGFNPYDLALVFSAWVAWRSLGALRHEAIRGVSSFATAIAAGYRLLLAVAFFILTTAALVRGVHQVIGVSWRWESLFESVVVQTSLSIYWGILGFSGMIWGARSQQRALWLAGAGFMALVVLKLFAVDLTQTGTIERIISFIGVGILLLVVGYFAPAPPRDERSSKVSKENRGQ